MPWYRSSIEGMRNASVLPEPVRAAPRTSRPARRGGMVLACTSVIFACPSSMMPAMVGLDRVMESNVLSLRIPSTCTWIRSPLGASFSGVSSSASSSSSSLSSSLSSSSAAAASSSFFFFFAAFLSLWSMPGIAAVSASSRSRFLAASFVFFFIVRRALSSSADIPEPPMVVVGRGSRRN